MCHAELATPPPSGLIGNSRPLSSPARSVVRFSSPALFKEFLYGQLFSPWPKSQRLYKTRSCALQKSSPRRAAACVLDLNPTSLALCSVSPWLTCPSDEVGPSRRWCCVEPAKPPFRNARTHSQGLGIRLFVWASEYGVASLTSKATGWPSLKGRPNLAVFERSAQPGRL